MPVGAFGGKAKIMNKVAPLGPVYQAGTLSANPIALSAGVAMIKEILKDGFYEKLEKKTRFLVDKINSHAEKKGYPLHLQQIGSIFWFAFSKKTIRRADEIDTSTMQYFNAMHKALLDKGMYLGPSGYEVGFVSASHTYKDLTLAAKVICKVLDKVLK